VEDFRADLIAEVTRRTGYPESMLDPELPLEAGLGIDSIKVMEIFSALKPYHRYLADREDSDEAILEQFTELKTLNEIIRHYAEKRSAAGSAALGMESVQAGVGNGRGSVSSNGHGPVERLVVRSVASAIIEDVDVTANPMGIPTNYGLLVLGDAPGLGVSVRAALRGAGYHTWQVIPGESEACKITSGSDYSVDLRSRQSVEAFARILREEESPAVGGIVNLLNLGLDFREPTRECSDAALGVAQSLLCVAQVFEREIRNSVENGGGLVVNLTALDGRFGLSGSRPLPLAQAASLGFMKSLAQEWRGVRVKTVDVDPEADPEVLLMVLARELASSNGSIEVGVGQNQRWMIDPAVVLNGNGSTSSNGGNGETDHRAVASENFAGEFPIEKDSVVLVTGGARGIAAEALKSLVGSVQTRLVIVGRSSAFGEEDEPPVVRGLDDVNLVRKALIEMDGNGGLGSAEIEGQVERVVKARAIRANLEHFERAGSSVEYHAFDVRDEVRLTELVASVYDRYGRIDAVIHAAGIIEDHLIRGKDPESFARVFATKVEPAFTLARVLRPESLRFFGMFSSVSARFGNAGQTDYGSANEVLNKLAGHLDREWPGRVVSINWGAWDSGMVSEGLKAAYRSRGIRLISPDAGGKAFLEEMRRGKEPAPEVILACDVDAIARAGSGESRV
jgi:NAD(P)-dependent dehydrogenase (short-subunit alcohol dehydrogenase family)